MKNIFLIGDSITLQYTDRVSELLGDSVKIWRTVSDMSNFQVENARWTGYTLNNLARHKWLSGLPERFDAIHWNNGIWDTVIRHPEDGCFTSPEEYARNLRKIARELSKLTDKVIFATTIPPRVDGFIDTASGFDFVDRYHEDTIQYNQNAKEVLPEYDVMIEDMYSLVLPKREIYVNAADNTHLTNEGMEACAKLVYNTLSKVI